LNPLKYPGSAGILAGELHLLDVAGKAAGAPRLRTKRFYAIQTIQRFTGPKL